VAVKIDKDIFGSYVESTFAGFADKIDLEERKKERKITRWLLIPECVHFD